MRLSLIATQISSIATEAAKSTLHFRNPYLLLPCFSPVPNPKPCAVPFLVLLYVAPAVSSGFDSRHGCSPHPPILRPLLCSGPPRPPTLPENFGCWEAHGLPVALVSCDGE